MVVRHIENFGGIRSEYSGENPFDTKRRTGVRWN